NVALVLDPSKALENVIHEMSNVGNVAVAEHKGIISLVGWRITDSPQLMNKLFNALSKHSTAMISTGASSSSVSVVIDDDVILDSVKCVHAEFFTGEPDGEMFESL